MQMQWIAFGSCSILKFQHSFSWLDGLDWIIYYERE